VAGFPALATYCTLRLAARCRASHQKARSRLSTWLPRSLTGLTACRHCPLKPPVCEGQRAALKRWEHEHVLEAVQQRLDKARWRDRVDHGTICGRSCANSGHYKPLCACVDRTFVNPNSSRRRPEKFCEARRRRPTELPESSGSAATRPRTTSRRAAGRRIDNRGARRRSMAKRPG
jgi:hypothetical protein